METDDSIANDVEVVSRIDAVPLLLQLICQTTGAGFAAIARVTDTSWTACAVRDDISFGLQPGGRLEIDTTLCKDVRERRAPIAFDDAATHPAYCGHPAPKLYGFKSYISVPIVIARNDEYFGNLCALDPRPLPISDQRTLDLFALFAQLLGRLIDDEQRQRESDDALHRERSTGVLREQFIAVLGHDLRDPLSAINAIATLLDHPTMPAELRPLSGRLRNSVHRMTGLIDDVLDLTRGRLGNGMTLRRERHDAFEAVLAQVVSDLEIAHADRNVVSHFDIPAPVYCDGSRVQQLLSNMVKNALTHGSPDVPIRVEVVLADGWLNLSVHNGGAVSEEDQLKRMDEPFWRPSSGGRRQGLGLGLYICSQIVRAHGGQFEAVSNVAIGTCFQARLPVTANSGTGQP